MRDSHRNVDREVYPVLVFAFADTPARRGWALTCGHSGRSGCDKCGIRGVKILPSGQELSSVSFLGYCEPAPALYLKRSAAAADLTSDVRLWLLVDLGSTWYAIRESVYELQDWELTTVKFAKPVRGTTVYDADAVSAILVTDAVHRARSSVAETESRKAAAAEPLPPQAADGGDLRSDPSSPAQVSLSSSAFSFCRGLLTSVLCYDFITLPSVLQHAPENGKLVSSKRMRLTNT